MTFSRAVGPAVLVAAAVAGGAAGWVAGRTRTVGVSGPSMVPTLSHGDALLAYPARRVRTGDVVIARFRARPDLLVVKRATRRYGDAWWVQGDNAAIADDSRRYGPADVLGRVVLRYWPRVSRTALRGAGHRAPRRTSTPARSG